MTEPPTRPPAHERRLTPDYRHRASYETAESSNSGSLRNATPTTDRTLEVPDDNDLQMNSSPADAPGRRDDRSRRRPKHRSNGAFLLNGSVGSDREQGSRRTSRNMLLPKTRALPRTPEQSRSSGSHEVRSRGSANRDSRHNTASPHGSSGGHSEAALNEHLHAGTNTPAENDQSPSAPDIDSTQIVNMALNLSESRRIASRRTVSRTNPPRLAPLPDAGTGSSLRQHFQQARKTSRNLSPKPGHLASPGIPSGAGANSPLQSAFDAGHDGQYRYQFSQSTLARAQKAREHLELMAEYRRLLETLPPLKPGHDRDYAASPPSSPVERRAAKFGLARPPPASGRVYNPLQYIRNRKVRARERKVIDGERQGFADVECVRAWVDDMSRRASSDGTSSTSNVYSMPPFPGADDPASQTSPDASAKTAQRVRRPRVDWFMEPCDIVADAYWLEQDNHKSLVEDRHWRKIFPPVAEVSRPISGQGQEPEKGALPFKGKLMDDDENAVDMKEFGLSQVETGLSQASTKERAKQKIQDFKFPHRHSGSVSSHHDFLRLRRDSTSDLSGSDNETKIDPVRRTRHGRSNTISSNTNELLEKQMLEMITKEAREKELEDVQETEAEHRDGAEVKTPERASDSKSPPSRMESRKASIVDTSDSDHRPATRQERIKSMPGFRSGRQSLEVRSGRQSLEVPEDYHRRSLDYDSSLPNSPELAATRGRVSVPIIGADMSPAWSRAGSPARNPIARVKQKLREMNRETANEPLTGAGEGDDDPFMPEPTSPSEGIASPERRPSSPLAQIATRPTGDSYKTHRSAGSIRMRDDQGVLRGMFKGPRIDTVIRGSVSKLGDILWKKDGSSDSPQDVDTTDESDSDAARGRRRPSASLSRRESKREHDARHESKHFLDSMPQFNNIAELSGKSGNDSQHLRRPSISRTQSRQSSRFDLLKPPPLDVRSASPSVSPPSVRLGRVGESDVSDSESWRSSVPDGVKAADRRLNSVISSSNLAGENGRSVSRHWSITDRSAPTRTHLSKREVARARALILSSGIKAMEIGRRANEPRKPFEENSSAENDGTPLGKSAGIPWKDIAQLVPDPPGPDRRQTPYCELYPLAASNLAMAVQASGQRWQSSADHFTGKTSLDMQNRIWNVRTRVADDLSGLTRRAADEADETSKDLALDQPLRVKHVVDIIEKMLRKRRRRFRWVRRGLWLTVEWLLVGLMWYVWFVVMILRVFFGVGRGFLAGVKWLLWL